MKKMILCVEGKSTLIREISKKYWETYALVEFVQTMQDALLSIRNMNNYISILVCTTDGFTYLPALKELRKLTVAPICVFTSKYSPEEMVDATRSGADLFSSYPKSNEELITATWALIRRHLVLNRHDFKESVLVTREMALVPDERLFFVNGQRIDLTHHEFEFLRILMQRSGHVHTYDYLYSTIWKEEPFSDIRPALGCLVSRLRQKLCNAHMHNGNVITNIRGIGYKIDSIAT